jgi:LacI family transcriptional regulator
MPPPRARKPTINDVADLAGVSIKTVSRVMNKEPNVRDVVREKVMAAVTELGYQPSMSARSLAGERSFLIGLFYGDTGGQYTHDIQLGMLNRCRLAGYHLLVEEIDYKAPDVADRAGMLVNQVRMAGVVLLPPVTDNPIILNVLQRAGVPYVRVAPDRDIDTSPIVRIDEWKATRDLAEHLLALGHRRIGFIKGKPAHAATRLRYAGFCEALADRGLAPVPDLVEQGEFSFETGMECAMRMLSRPDRPTAILASNDEMAAGAVAAARQLSIAVPEQLSIVGFDDMPIASQVWPQLTTIHQPVTAMAEAAADILVELIRRKDAGVWDNPLPHRHLDHKLVIRASTAPASG